MTRNRIPDVHEKTVMAACGTGCWGEWSAEVTHE